ncbi:MAG: hypothetical protein LQ344_004793 [Seirophora lacunosa]|nr:MAG: hypothetical protein LQ344_004793 [Seirophora lacunosa]
MYTNLPTLLLLALTTTIRAIPTAFPVAQNSAAPRIDRVRIISTTEASNRTAESPVRAAMSPGVYHLATAGPTPHPGLQQGKVSIEFCTDVDYEGLCQHLDSMRGTCYDLWPPFNNSVSSVAPDGETYCTLYMEPECTFDDRAPLRDIINPGIYDLREYDGFSDSVSSYQCV